MSDLSIFETETFVIKQTDGYLIPGYVIVESKLNVNFISEYNQSQLSELFRAMNDVEKMVNEILKPERVYIMKFAEVNPKVHFHIVPRTVEIGKCYESMVDDQAPYNGAKLIDWLWSNHKQLNYKQADLKAFVEQAKSFIGSS